MAFEGLKDRWAEIPKWQKWIGYIVLLVIAAYIYKIKVIDPLTVRVKQLEVQVSRKRIRVARLLAIEKRRDELIQEIADLKEKIAALEAKLPTGTEEVSGIIRSIANDTGNIEIGLIKRGKEQNKQYYSQIDYIVVMKTKYPNFIKWCESISKANRILTFGDMTLMGLAPERGQKKGKKYNPYKYTVQVKLNLNAYTLKR